MRHCLSISFAFVLTLMMIGCNEADSELLPDTVPDEPSVEEPTVEEETSNDEEDTAPESNLHPEAEAILDSQENEEMTETPDESAEHEAETVVQEDFREEATSGLRKLEIHIQIENDADFVLDYDAHDDPETTAALIPDGEDPNLLDDSAAEAAYLDMTDNLHLPDEETSDWETEPIITSLIEALELNKDEVNAVSFAVETNTGRSLSFHENIKER
ncbi:hypothetical protein B0H94_11512 [Salsuginibacillus halophilus]|uniref:YusW-like protein n=1 Tax=Salsuginibacillus halophilus TaxID=517424 RepID=A0A2P8H899_9BACI|nr:hypothetical protein [Salsuginibacillus halophilus]PSL42409.1 hypothetical protein B0H94_11512 [Salsuginibacillus halophilus]